MSTLTRTMFLQIGKRRYQVASFEQASVMFCKARDAAGCGASKINSQMIVDENGETIAHVSYNGRVWPGSPKDWRTGVVPLYDNRRPRTEVEGARAGIIEALGGMNARIA